MVEKFKKSLSAPASLLLAILIILSPLMAQAANDSSLIKPTFNPHHIISDIELTDNEAMSENAIRRFLLSRPGILGTYKTRDINGVERDAAAIIWRAAQNYGISPKFLIALIQREQSLIDDPSPTNGQIDWATGYGICDSCKSTEPGLQKFKGFARQVDQAAWRNRYYLAYPDKFKVRVGQPILIDGTAVIPATQATANLYIYTPHLNGNKNFWIIWRQYFGKQYRDGTLLQDEASGDVWLLQNGKLRLFLSKSALYADHDVSKIVVVSPSDLDQYDLGTPIKFPAYSLLKSPGDTVYLLVDGVRRGLASPEVFRVLGYNPEEVFDVSWDDINLYPEGEPITVNDSSPLGELWQNNITGGVYHVINGVKHAIIAREILQSRFSKYSIKPVPPSDLKALENGDPAYFQDGEIVKSSTNPTVYVIANGTKSAIGSEELFLELGYKWSNVIVTTEQALEIHKDSAPIAG